MDLDAKDLLVDEIYQHQQNLLATVLMLNKFDVAITDIDMILHVQLVPPHWKI